MGADTAVHRLVLGNEGPCEPVERLGRLCGRLAGAAGLLGRLHGPAHAPGQVDRRRPRPGDHAGSLFQATVEIGTSALPPETATCLRIALPHEVGGALVRRALEGGQHHRRRPRHADSRRAANGQRLHGIHDLAPVRGAHKSQIIWQKPLVHEPHHGPSLALLNPDRPRQVPQIKIHVISFILALSCMILLCYINRGRWCGRLFFGRSYHGFFARAIRVLLNSN